METTPYSPNGDFPLSPDSSSQNQHPRRAKRPIADDMKDDRYWEKRKRNNEAAKKSREAKRCQEYSIRERMLVCEQENAMLRQELARLRADRDASRLALANEGHIVPGYGPGEQQNHNGSNNNNNSGNGNNNIDYNQSSRSASPIPRVNLPSMHSFQNTNQESPNYQENNPIPQEDTKPPLSYYGTAPQENLKPSMPFYGAPPHFQYGNPFGFYVAAYGQGYHRYPVPVAMTDNTGNAFSGPPPVVPERTTDEPRPETGPPRVDSPKDVTTEVDQSTTEKVDEIKAENADLKTKLRDLEQAVSYMRDMSHLQNPRSDIQNGVEQKS